MELIIRTDSDITHKELLVAIHLRHLDVLDLSKGFSQQLGSERVEE